MQSVILEQEYFSFHWSEGVRKRRFIEGFFRYLKDIVTFILELILCGEYQRAHFTYEEAKA